MIEIDRQYGRKTLWLDKAMITECLQNIFNNAVDAMNEEGTLRIHLESGKGKTRISISDTGSGMDSIQLQNIFEPFYSTKHKSGRHFGMGMYQVRKVMAAHKGKVEVKSKPGQGTTVTLIFK
ncbi:ATP-binding protein [Paenibacillus senegalensis]|uniref:ATP-binding protein n=1 Tax=Paenibacillus senegalensis TaxID=1465766 RepID=UPI0012FB9AA9|nr:ATP-binding protein [Paenibacillus senegalensis]